MVALSLSPEDTRQYHEEDIKEAEHLLNEIDEYGESHARFSLVS